MDYQQSYKAYQELIEQGLDACLPLPEEDWPQQGRPRQLVEAMRYSLLAPGKRLRPVLLLAAGETCGLFPGEALPFALAVEMIHCYSLIHDDLPAMDDDDLRRGRPTSHKVYGEAMAILAGDALLNLAYETMAACTLPRAQQAMAQVAFRAGALGMIAGQVADMAGEKGAAGTASKDMLHYIHQHKTADLLVAPILSGLILGGANEERLQAAAAYGHKLGLAFQMTDDLLDLEGQQEQTGKAGQRDQQLGKLTWPAVYGRKQTRADAQAAVTEAAALAACFGAQESFFRALALAIPERVR